MGAGLKNANGKPNLSVSAAAVCNFDVVNDVVIKKTMANIEIIERFFVIKMNLN